MSGTTFLLCLYTYAFMTLTETTFLLNFKYIRSRLFDLTQEDPFFFDSFYTSSLTVFNQKFLGTFAKLRKATISFVISVRLSVAVCVSVCLRGSHLKDFHDI